MSTVSVSKRAQRALIVLGSLIAAALVYTYSGLLFPGDRVRPYVDDDWTRLDEIRSLAVFASNSDPKQTLLHLQDKPVERLTPLDFGHTSPSAIARWKEDVRGLDISSPLVVYSKTYCGFSRRVKKLLESYHISPPPKVIEVDLREDGDVIKAHLARLTGRSTFPNVFLVGRSIGGFDDTHELHQSGVLAKLFENAGLSVRYEGP